MKIMAIGGGENGRPGEAYETKEIDEEVVKMTGKKSPTLLFIGFTRAEPENAENYFNITSQNFNRLGCVSKHLKESDLSNTDLVNRLFENSDIIYIGGGDTIRLMQILKKFKLKKHLKSAMKRGCVLCGISAGAICLHKCGSSRIIGDKHLNLIKVKGLGFIPAMFCSHYDAQGTKYELIKNLMKTTRGVALAFSNCCALKIEKDQYQIIKSNPEAKAQKFFWKNGKYFQSEIPSIGTIKQLLKK